MNKKKLLDFLHERKQSIEINQKLFEEKGVTSVSIETYHEIQRALLHDIEKFVKRKIIEE